ncbi:MAG TPA: hypothetical protein VGG01_26340 [Xanthobacteraceae bacterium]
MVISAKPLRGGRSGGARRAYPAKFPFSGDARKLLARLAFHGAGSAHCGGQNALAWSRTGQGRAPLAPETSRNNDARMNQLDDPPDLYETRNPATKRVLLHGKAIMTQTRSTAAYVIVVDATTARIDHSAAAQSALARLPDGYDHADLRVLEWIAAHRPSRTKMSELAA